VTIMRVVQAQWKFMIVCIVARESQDASRILSLYVYNAFYFSGKCTKYKHGKRYVKRKLRIMPMSLL